MRRSPPSSSGAGSGAIVRNSRPPRSRKRQPGNSQGTLTLIALAALLVVSFASFFHSIHVLNVPQPHVDGSIQASLDTFVKTRKPKLSTPSATAPFVDDLAIHEDPIPNPKPSNGNTTFSACLLVMDDNHRLVEWMAYHYHVLPLRYLVVAIDPRSRTTPTIVLNRWRKMGVYVEEWDDFHFLRPEIAKHPIPDDAELQVKRDRHRIRQKNFYQTCLQHMKSANRTWVTLIDTDEFLMYNHKGGRDYEAWEAMRLQRHQASKYHEKVRVRLSQPPPTPAEEGQILPFLQREAAAGHPHFQRACISCPRLQFGAKESTPTQVAQGVPEGVLDADRLDTLRYRYHAWRQDFVKNGLSKSLLDVSRITTFPKIQSLHRPIKTICTAPWKDDWDSALRIYHYLGSWEAYSYRDDSRRGGERSYEGWVFKARDADETDDNIRPWISGFVEKHGKSIAGELLHGAGLPRGYQNEGGGKNWTIMFLDTIMKDNETKGNDVRVSFDNFVRDFHTNRNGSLEGLV